MRRVRPSYNLLKLYSSKRTLINFTKFYNNKIISTPIIVSSINNNNQYRLYSNEWSHVEEGPPDPILGITVAYNKDTNPKKINLGVGAYRDDKGKPHILNCVKRATQKIITDPKENHEYLPIGGEGSFNKVAVELLLGENNLHLKENRYTTVQALSGTGALRLAGYVLSNFYRSGPKKVYVPNPTWANHQQIFKFAGLDVGSYKYYDNAKNALDFNGLTGDLKNIPDGSILLLHACAHNPTGQDPSKEQWQQIMEIVKSKKLFALFDCAYQGFASGDCDRDAYPMRLFSENNINIAMCQSFAKNFGLYGERVGTLTFLTSTVKEAQCLESQIKILIRAAYSSPPKFGAKLIETILTNPELKSDFYVEVKEMADRIIQMRSALVEQLKVAGSKRDWNHITNQIGMFCYSGLTAKQVDRLADEFHIYMTKNGRISMAGVTSHNVAYLASSIHAVSKDS